MTMNEEFVQNVLKYFIPGDCTVPRNNIVKRHKGDLTSSGDYSFPIEAQKWKQLLNDEIPFFGITIFEYKARLPTGNHQSNYTDQFHQEEQINQLIEHSQQWSFPIQRGNVQRDRCVLYLNRLRVFRHHLLAVTTNSQYGRQSNRAEMRIVIDSATTSGTGRTITDYRQELVGRVIVNLLEYSTHSVDSQTIAKVQSMKCGKVKSPNADIVTADQYIQ